MRTKLLRTLLTTSVPLVGLMTWSLGEFDYRREVKAMQNFIVARMVDGRRACELNPEVFPKIHRFPMARKVVGSGGHPPLRVFAYGGDFVSRNPNAQPFPLGLRQSLEDGELFAGEVSSQGGEAILLAARRMPWDEGPCVIVLAIQKGYKPGWFSGSQITAAAALVLGMAITTYLAAGPIVSRLRLLTGEIRVVTSGHYCSRVTVAGDDEITVLARAFNTACSEIERRMQELQGHERDLRKFITNTMHDVMTPMTVLQGHVAELKQGAQDERRVAILKAATEESHYISSLLRNLAISARLENPALQLERTPVDLCALVQRVAARHQVIVQERELELNLGLPLDPVYADADITMIEQAVSNLVQNAVSYVPRCGRAAITLDTSGNDSWGLSIDDDGPGIDPDMVGVFLERTFRGNEARTRRPEGQGLGLQIAHEIVQLHGFELELRPSLHGGLRATIRGTSQPS